MALMTQESACELCGRIGEVLTKHHLIPRSRHHNKRNKKRFDREEIHTRVAWLCWPCHDNIHAHLTEKELENEFNTLELLAAHPSVLKFTDWIRSKPAGTKVPVKQANNRSEKWMKK